MNMATTTTTDSSAIFDEIKNFIGFGDDDVAALKSLAPVFAARGADFTVTAHTDLKSALDGVDFVFTTFRPGGLRGRHLDESIPLRHGVVGQETVGPGGFFMACRSVPVLLDIAAVLAS